MAAHGTSNTQILREGSRAWNQQPIRKQTILLQYQGTSLIGHFRVKRFWGRGEDRAQGCPFIHDSSGGAGGIQRSFLEGFSFPCLGVATQKSSLSV